MSTGVEENGPTTTSSAVGLCPIEAPLSSRTVPVVIYLLFQGVRGEYDGRRNWILL